MPVLDDAIGVGVLGTELDDDGSIRGTFGGGKPQAHLHDHPILDQDIGGGGAAQRRIGQTAATDEADALFLGGHCRVSSQEEVTDAALKGAVP